MFRLFQIYEINSCYFRSTLPFFRLLIFHPDKHWHNCNEHNYCNDNSYDGRWKSTWLCVYNKQNKILYKIQNENWKTAQRPSIGLKIQCENPAHWDGLQLDLKQKYVLIQCIVSVNFLSISNYNLIKECINKTKENEQINARKR